MASEKKNRPCVVLVPGPGLGHLNGSLALATSLLPHALDIVLVCFARSHALYSNANMLRSAHPSIRFHVLPDGFPPSSTSPAFQDLFAVTPSMHHNLLAFLNSLLLQQPVSCIVSDTFMSWTQDVADHLRIPRVDFWTTTATSYCGLLALPELLEQGLIGLTGATLPWKSKNPVFVDCVPGLPRYPLEDIPSDFRVGDPSDPLFVASLQVASRARKAERVLIHSVYELESDAFDGLREAGIAAYAIGPLPFDCNPTRAECLSWLDTQANSSVIYVSFGSNAVLSPQEILELAFGLEASGQPFLWVIRSDAVNGELSDMLPEGFQARTKERGLIVSWGPQVAVLEHAAVGGFLTHCGWNSTVESLWMGVPMLGCPRRAEQRSNARYIGEVWGVGIEMGRTEEGSFERGQVERGVRALMAGEEGKMARSKAMEAREVVRRAGGGGGASHSNLLKLAHDMSSSVKQSTIP